MTRRESAVGWVLTVAAVIGVTALAGWREVARSFAGVLAIALFPVFFFAPWSPVILWFWIVRRMHWPRWVNVATLIVSLLLCGVVAMVIERAFGPVREW